MKKSRKDIQQDILLKMLKPLVYIWMWLDAKRKVYKGDGVDFRRKEPYVMLANHTYLFDVVHVPLRFKRTPFIIASQTLFTKQPTKFLVSQVAHVIPKSKGRSDFNTIKKVFQVIDKGYPVLIFPEGNTTFYGETGYIEPATMKLIKKLKLDVITCNIKGGYLSRPRWATGKRNNHKIELFYNLTIPKERLAEMSIEEIDKEINTALYNNDYQFQRDKMIIHKGKKLAEGIENVVYVCPHCEGINTIASAGNKIYCTNCHAEGKVNELGFIEGFKFDNLIDWNKFQLQYNEKLRDTTVKTTAFMNYLQMETEEQIPIGKIEIVYKDKKLHFTGAHEEIIPISEIKNANITLRRDLGFIYNDKNYFLNLDKYSASLLRILQNKY
jgi:1-acyl-sn-glycerol-3-phosphate acyltransferase